MEMFCKLIEKATLYIGVHNHFVGMIRRGMDFIRDFAKEDPRLLLATEMSGKGRITWNNGVFDLRTHALLPFSPDIVIFSLFGAQLSDNR
jgi:hypothetical protein